MTTAINPFFFYLAVAVGGALGAVARYWMQGAVQSIASRLWPGPAQQVLQRAAETDLLSRAVGTLSVNLLGSLLIGLFYVILAEKLSLSSEWRGLVVVGFLGAFTTFSTFSLDALLLLQEGQHFQAVLYLASSVIGCLLAVWMGMSLARAL